VESHLISPPAEATAAKSGSAVPPGAGLPSGTAVPALAAPATAPGPGGGQVFERPSQDRQHTQTRPWVMLAAFGMGAGIALGSAAIGWVLGRAGRR
jgi:hypothetical protein